MGSTRLFSDSTELVGVVFEELHRHTGAFFHKWAEPHAHDCNQAGVYSQYALAFTPSLRILFSMGPRGEICVTMQHPASKGSPGE